MSRLRSALGSARGFAVVVVAPLTLFLAALACVGSLLRSLLRGRRPPPCSTAGTAAVLVYAGPIRRWMRTWGAPGPAPAAAEPVHAVEIAAPAEEVWPWVAQIGQDRGGFYSYEWLENIAGCRMRNADRIHPEWQHREIDEKVMLHPRLGLPVSRFEPGRVLALAGWGSFEVEAIDARRSRVVVRGEPQDDPLFRAYYAALIELPHFLMERRMLLGIKERAERGAPPPRRPG